MDVVALARRRGLRLRETEAGALDTTCPFCPPPPEAPPTSAANTLCLDPAANRFRCTACNREGGPADWVAAEQGVSRRHAEELLRAGVSEAGPAAPSKYAPTDEPKRTTRRFLHLELSADATDSELLEVVADHYHQALLAETAPEADKRSGRRSLHLRGLDDPALIAHFRIGVANRTLGYRLPAANRKRGAALRGRLQTLGVYRDTGHERMRGRVTVPVVDHRGHIVDLYGFPLLPSSRMPDDAYLRDDPPADLPFFHAAALCHEATEQVIVAGGVLDALILWRHGLQAVVALWSLRQRFEPRHVETLTSRGISRVFFALPRTAEGEALTKRAALLLTAAGLEVFQAVLPRGLDVSAFARSAPEPREALWQRLRGAEWLGQGSPSKAPWALLAQPGDDARPKPRPAEGPSVRQLAAETIEPRPKPAPAPAPPPRPMPAPPPVSQPAPPEAAPSYDPATDELSLVIADRHWRARGLRDNPTLRALRVNLLVTREGAGYHIDDVSLYAARQRNAFIREAAAELVVPPRVLKRDLGRMLLQLEAAQERRLADIEAARQAELAGAAAVELSDDEHTAAMALLKDPRLVERIAEDFVRCGVVGDTTNLLVGYLCAISRKLDRPLGLVVQSSSAAGKTTQTDAILAMVPPEDRLSFSAMTGQSLYYLGQRGGAQLRHKVLHIAEEEGARRASYALKLLQSEGQLTIASTGKDAAGRMTTERYEVHGPVMLMMTTTSIHVDEELLNRCLVLTVDESRAQTRRIHARQRHRLTLDGMVAARDKSAVVTLHQNAQRLLSPIAVVNPYADRLTFVDHATRTRRDHQKYLGLIQAIALLHQHQRQRKALPMVEDGGGSGEALSYIEVAPSDIDLANRLCAEVLGQSLDQLPPQTRVLLEAVHALVQAKAVAEGVRRDDVRLTRRQVREHTGWGQSQLRVHLERLVEMEYLLRHQGRSDSGGRLVLYELCWDGGGRDGQRHMSGLLDVSELVRPDEP